MRVISFDISMYYMAFRPRSHSKGAFFFLSFCPVVYTIPYRSFGSFKGLICIRRVSGVGDAKSPAIPEIWLSPRPFFSPPSYPILYTASTIIMPYMCTWEILVSKGWDTIIVMAPSSCRAHWILIVFPEEQKLVYDVYNNNIWIDRGCCWKKIYLR